MIQFINRPGRKVNRSGFMAVLSESARLDRTGERYSIAVLCRKNGVSVKYAPFIKQAMKVAKRDLGCIHPDKMVDYTIEATRALYEASKQPKQAKEKVSTPEVRIAERKLSNASLEELINELSERGFEVTLKKVFSVWKSVLRMHWDG